jgi:ELWxxDGT repeat protein
MTAAKSKPRRTTGSPRNHRLHRLVRLGLAAATLTALIFTAAPATAQEVMPLGDLSTEVNGIGSSLPAQFLVLGNWTIFVARDREHGRELWRTDGTTSGTTVLADIAPGRRNSNPNWLVVFDNHVYFSADDGGVGRELWRTDGTPEGTERVADILPGPASSSPSYLTPVGDQLFFTATTPEYGRELWVLPVGGAPEMVADLRPGPENSSPRDLMALDQLLAFSYFTPETGRELGISDGTEAGTELHDWVGGETGTSPRPLASIGDHTLFVSAHVPAKGRELWRQYVGGTRLRLTDGVEDEGDGNPDHPAMLDDELLFSLQTDTGPALWKSDGTLAGTGEVNAQEAYGLVAWEGQVFFVSEGDLWKTNGTSAGTELVADLASPIGKILDQDAWLVPHASELLFIAGDLYSSDGTSGGTGVYSGCGVANCNDVLWMVSGADALYLTLFDPFSAWEPWRAAGGSLNRLKNISTNIGNSLPIHHATHDGKIYFSAEMDDVGRELATWDGEAASAWLYEDIRPGETSSVPRDPAATDSSLYYVANGAGVELRRITDPTLGTEVVFDNSSGGRSPTPLATDGDRLFFSAREDTSNIRQLWEFDGTSAQQISSFADNDIHAGLQMPLPNSAVVLNGEVYFGASDGILGIELYKSDGNSVDLVMDLEPGPGHSFPDYLLRHDSQIFFAADVSGSRGLWRTDGSAQNTTLVREFGGIAFLHSVGSRVVFVAREEATGLELWTSDGTPGGTMILADIAPGPADGIHSSALSFANTGNRLYFTAGNATHGLELWATDGTPGGTAMVADIRPGIESSRPDHMVALPDGGVVFSAYTETAGVELWHSDGTSAGTRRVSDIAPGPASTDPWNPKVFGDWVIFTAWSGPTGAEPWAYRWNPAPEIFSDRFESGATNVP